MFSAPAATSTSASPQRIAWAEHDRLEAGPADLVDGRGAHARGKTGADGGLPADVLAQARAEDVADDDFLDLCGGNSGPADGRLDGDAAQGRRRDLGQRSAEAADRRSRAAGEEYSVVHRRLLA